MSDFLEYSTRADLQAAIDAKRQALAEKIREAVGKSMDEIAAALVKEQQGAGQAIGSVVGGVLGGIAEGIALGPEAIGEGISDGAKFGGTVGSSLGPVVAGAVTLPSKWELERTLENGGRDFLHEKMQKRMGLDAHVSGLVLLAYDKLAPAARKARLAIDAWADAAESRSLHNFGVAGAAYDSAAAAALKRARAASASSSSSMSAESAAESSKKTPTEAHHEVSVLAILALTLVAIAIVASSR